jgi:phospholipase C
VSTTNEIFRGDDIHPSAPYGLGIRVPMIIVSPWTRGGWVDSQLFDHTSLIRFLETRFAHGNRDLVEANITPWRRAVVGDLTSAFDFRTPNTSRVRLPDTDDFKPENLVRYPDEVPVPPTDPRLPHQERGVRPARAIPYTLHVDGHAPAGSFTIDFRNAGAATGVFQVRSADAAQAPRTYTVEPGKRLSDSWDFGSGYDLEVHGPNGFFRHFKGGGGVRVDVVGRYDERGDLVLEVTNRGEQRVNVAVANRYGGSVTALALKPGDARTERWSLTRTRGWYDLTLTVRGDTRFEVRYAGHVENGEDSISDPGMGGLV